MIALNLLKRLLQQEEIYYWILLKLWISLSIFVFIVLFFISAPYGRHSRSGWGFTLNNRWAWFLMELPSPLIILICFYYRENNQLGENYVTFIFLLLWQLHYINRAIFFPLRLIPTRDVMNSSVFVLCILFNALNAYFNGRYLWKVCDPFVEYPGVWQTFTQPRVFFGLLLFLAGMIINQQSDSILINMKRELKSKHNSNDYDVNVEEKRDRDNYKSLKRKQKPTNSYGIPKGGFF